jgi:hypothetical protein
MWGLNTLNKFKLTGVAVAGFLLFLLVTLSPPYIPSIFLVGVRAGSGTDIHFGVYGECYSYSASWYVYRPSPYTSPISFYMFTLGDSSAMGEEKLTNRAGYPETPAAGCDHLGLGYEAFFTSTGRPGPDTSPDRPVIISRNLSKGLGMNPVTVVFAGLSAMYVGLAYLKPAGRLPKVYSSTSHWCCDLCRKRYGDKR